MTNGKPVVGEGMAAADGNAKGLCEYSGTLELPADGGQEHEPLVVRHARVDG